jgi:2-polyprenyl-3-methyl-5-hydroxy-6-metoxy-1,4-benzoquinol methylase
MPDSLVTEGRIRRPADPYVAASYSQTWARCHGTTFDQLADPTVRRRKALKIAAVVADFVGRPLGELRCLDVGCSAGAIASSLAERLGEVVGVDPDRPAVELARERHRRPNLRFEAGTLADLLPRLGQFDVVVCNHVYEHVHDQRGLVRSIHAALAPGGCCYFSAGNALTLLEGHYGLPLLSWLPPDLASAYLRLTRRGRTYRERHLTLWGLRRLLRDFRVHDYTLRVLAEPARFSAEELAVGPLPRGLLPIVGRAIYPLVPTYLWMLTPR